MRLTVILFFLCFAVIYGCRKDETITACVESKIEELKNFSCEFGASVKQYKFQGETIYVFSMGWCARDFPAGVINNECNSIGSLGGFSGNTKINGVEFSTATYIKTIWSR